MLVYYLINRLSLLTTHPLPSAPHYYEFAAQISAICITCQPLTPTHYTTCHPLSPTDLSTFPYSCHQQLVTAKIYNSIIALWVTGFVTVVAHPPLNLSTTVIHSLTCQHVTNCHPQDKTTTQPVCIDFYYTGRKSVLYRLSLPVADAKDLSFSHTPANELLME